MKGHGNIGALTEYMMNSGVPPGEEETHAACARLPTMPRMPVETARMPPVDAGAAAPTPLPCEPHEMAVYAYRCPEILINRRSWLDALGRYRHDGRDRLR